MSFLIGREMRWEHQQIQKLIVHCRKKTEDIFWKWQAEQAHHLSNCVGLVYLLII
jgi:23S rRNA maturation-related 3'-5' exoribonuclease YhaM